VYRPERSPRPVRAARARPHAEAAETSSRFIGPHAPLFADGIAVRDEFVSASRVRGLIDCARRRRERGDFSVARVGAQRREEIRGDSTCWLAEPLFEEERTLLRDLEVLRLELNREGFLGLFDLECHYAWYPPGAGYARHLDQLRGQDQRKVSLILYLNQAWEPAAGGELRLFGAAADFRDIEPTAGRLVYFLTAGREHAVLATRCDRLSISGWFRSRSGEIPS
jgi:SM-20-related protein